MKGKQLALVFALLIAIAATGAIFRLTSGVASSPTLTGLFNVSSEEFILRLASVTIRSADQQATLVKEGIGGNWNVGPERVFQPRLAQLLEAVGRLESAQLVAQNRSSHARTGVTSADGINVSFQRGSAVVEIIVGKWSPEAGLSYLRRPSENAVYALPLNLPSIFEPNPDGWRNPIVMDLFGRPVDSLSFTYATSAFDLVREGPAWFVESGNTKFPAEPLTVQVTLRGLAPLVASGFANEEEANALEFDEPDAAITVSVADVAAPTTVMFIRRDDGSYFVKASDEDSVFVVAGEAAALVLRKEEDFAQAAGR